MVNLTRIKSVQLGESSKMIQLFQTEGEGVENDNKQTARVGQQAKSD